MRADVGPACAMFSLEKKQRTGFYSGKQEFSLFKNGEEARDSSVVWAGFSLSDRLANNDDIILLSKAQVK
jgi:hypothetical protein